MVFGVVHCVVFVVNGHTTSDCTVDVLTGRRRSTERQNLKLTALKRKKLEVQSWR